MHGRRLERLSIRLAYAGDRLSILPTRKHEMYKATLRNGALAIAVCAILAACGTSPGERALSGGGIGAGVGLGAAAVLGGPLIAGAALGAAVGAVTGAVTTEDEIDLD
jgi:osmotically inducible lipoprotein OsmB